MKGFISLYDCDEEIVACRHYENKSTRDLIIDNWKKLYARKYHECYLQIAPDEETPPKSLPKKRFRNKTTIYKESLLEKKY